MPFDEYATHLPVLRGYRPRTVLEFGPGLHSTAHFLSLPCLKRLVSIEHNQEWHDRLALKFQDPRWELRRSIPPWPAPRNFDLVLIDDGDTYTQRVETIRWVLKRKHPVVVIHDAEVGAYKELLEGVDHFVYDALTPHTAVVAAS
jgi:predicted O-methyltransferase YrrM